MDLSPFMRCECGKLHLRTFVSVTTLCKCGRNLWKKAWGIK